MTQLAHAIGRIAARLNSLANDVDRCVQSTLNTPGSATGPSAHPYARIAEQMQSDILWTLANLNIAGLTTMAADADAYRSNPEVIS